MVQGVLIVTDASTKVFFRCYEMATNLNMAKLQYLRELNKFLFSMKSSIILFDKSEDIIM